MARPDRVRSLVLDVGVAATLAVAMLLEARADDATDVGPLTVSAIVLAVLPLLLRRRRPVLALVGCLLGIVLIESLMTIYQTIPLPSMLAGYAVARSVDRRRATWLGLVLLPVVLVNLAVASDHAVLSLESLKNVAFVAFPILLGVAARSRSELLAALTDRAEAAERTREQEAARRVDEERLRIARDLHDVVAHALVAINVQAGVAAHVADPDPEANRRTLREIKDVSGEALTDLRETLGLLRVADEEVRVAPTAGLADLTDLVPRLEGAGVDLDIDIDLGADPPPAAIEGTAYRIVQEALTNVMRHAAPTSARVAVRREHGAIVLEVEDDGPREDRPRDPGSGNGVRGMRERAVALGGTVQAGPPRSGGWRVEARLPLAPVARSARSEVAP